MVLFHNQQWINKNRNYNIEDESYLFSFKSNIVIIYSKNCAFLIKQ